MRRIKPAIRQTAETGHTLHDAGIPVGSAMQNDVSRIGQCFAADFADLGIHSLPMGVNSHKAPRLLRRSDRLPPVTPSRKEMLVYRWGYCHIRFVKIPW